MKAVISILTVTTMVVALRNIDQSNFPRYEKGAIFNYNGKVALISKYIAVQIDFNHLMDVPTNFTKVGNTLHAIANNLKMMKDLDIGNVNLKPLVQEFINTLNHAKNRLDVAISWFPKKTRTKRGLINIVGSGLKYLFGTATDSEIQDLKDRITTLQDIRRKNDRILESLHTQSKLCAKKLNEIIEITNDIVDFRNYFQRYSQNLESLTYFSHLSLTIDQKLSDIINEVKNTIDSVTLATLGTVTTSLLTIPELTQILDKATTTYKLTPLFDNDNLILYFSYMNVQIAPANLIIHIPMSTSYIFHHFSIIPFPTFHLNQSIILDIDNTNIFVSENLEFFVNIHNKDLTNSCNHHESSLIVCESHKLILERNPQTCQASIIKHYLNNLLKKQCNYQLTCKSTSVQVVDQFM